MHFTETALAGAYVVDVDRREDERGFFARSWCRDEFARHGLAPRLAQCNISFNRRRGTLRGMHFQRAPYEEAKVVRCTRGRILDVLLDLRPASPTFCRWIGVELSADNHRMLYVPEGVAHGFQTLDDDTELFYQMSETYHAEAAAGVRWNDPRFGIEWPIPSPIVSERDAAFPDFTA
jgi:dTDP-4-dehydrorhamnose 3,5-epimerase